MPIRSPDEELELDEVLELEEELVDEELDDEELDAEELELDELELLVEELELEEEPELDVPPQPASIAVMRSAKNWNPADLPPGIGFSNRPILFALLK